MWVMKQLDNLQQKDYKNGKKNMKKIILHKHLILTLNL